tara:strand:- start:5217 stop:6176 length:960 start_codon:yes stop_codon:yes gene_type:complete
MSGTLSDSSGYGLSTVTDNKQSKVFSEISKLQDMEKTLYAELQDVASSGGGTSEQQNIIDQINKLSSMRIDLFSGLSDNYAVLQDSVAQSRNDLVNQITTTNVVESQLGAAKNNLDQLKNIKNNNQRMTEINTYYGHSYQANTHTMRLIIYTSIPILIFAALRKFNLLSAGITGGLITISLLIGGFIIIKHLMDINARDNMVFNEYDWRRGQSSWKTDDQDNSNTTDNDQTSTITDKAKDEWDQLTSGSGCINQDCCSDGTTFNSKTKKCEPTTTTETFQNGRFPPNVAYVASPSPACPWGSGGSNILPYSSNPNYATV